MTKEYHLAIRCGKENEVVRFTSKSARQKALTKLLTAEPTLEYALSQTDY